MRSQQTGLLFKFIFCIIPRNMWCDVKCCQLLPTDNLLCSDNFNQYVSHTAINSITPICCLNWKSTQICKSTYSVDLSNTCKLKLEENIAHCQSNFKLLTPNNFALNCFASNQIEKLTINGCAIKSSKL